MFQKCYKCLRWRQFVNSIKIVGKLGAVIGVDLTHIRKKFGLYLLFMLISFSCCF